MLVQSLGQDDPLEKRMATNSSIPAWRISWTEEPGGLQSMGSQRVVHNLATKQQQQSSVGSSWKSHNKEHSEDFLKHWTEIHRNRVIHSKYYWVLRGFEHRLVSHLRRVICHCSGSSVCEFPPHPICLTLLWCYSSSLFISEDEMVGWHHWLNGHEFEQTQGDSEGQGSLMCCSPWGHKESLWCDLRTELTLKFNLA